MKPTLLFTLVLTCQLACHQDTDTEINVIETPDPPAVLITTKLVSQTDTTIAQTSNSFQIFAGLSSSFQELPYSYTKGVNVNRDFELIRLKDPNQFEYYHVLSLIENDVNYLHWKIPVPEQFTGQSTSDIQVPITNDLTISIPANAILNLDSTEYTGPYMVSYSALNPSSESILSIPSFTGRDENNVVVSLLFEKCIYLTIRSPEGIELKFSSNAFIQSNDVTNADQWAFDENTGTWKQLIQDADHKLHLDDRKYYAYADQHPMIRCTGKLDVNGISLINQPIHISYEGQTRIIYTTNNGAWSIQLPFETLITAETVLSCGTSSQFKFTSGKDIIQLHVENEDIKNIIVRGTAHDCDGTPLHNHLIQLYGEQKTIIYNPDPEISLNIPVCDQSYIGLSDLNPVSGQSGPNIYWPVSDTIDLHSTFACDMARNEYLSLTVSGEHKIYWDLKSSLNPQNRLIIENTVTDPDFEFQVAVTGLTTGRHMDNMVNILFEDMHLGSKGYSLYCPSSSSCGFSDFTITQFGEQSGQWIRGYFSGRFWIKTFHPLTAGYRQVEGEFQVYREF